MKQVLIALIFSFLAGCISYPYRNIASPEYKFIFNTKYIAEVYILKGISYQNPCKNGEKLKNTQSEFVSQKRHSLIKTSWLVPVTSSNDLYLCAISESGEIFEWKTTLRYYGSLAPDDMAFTCELEGQKLVCHEQKNITMRSTPLTSFAGRPKAALLAAR